MWRYWRFYLHLCQILNLRYAPLRLAPLTRAPLPLWPPLFLLQAEKIVDLTSAGASAAKKHDNVEWQRCELSKALAIAMRSLWANQVGRMASLPCACSCASPCCSASCLTYGPTCSVTCHLCSVHARARPFSALQAPNALAIAMCSAWANQFGPWVCKLFPHSVHCAPLWASQAHSHLVPNPCYSRCAPHAAFVVRKCLSFWAHTTHLWHCTTHHTPHTFGTAHPALHVRRRCAMKT